MKWCPKWVYGPDDTEFLHSLPQMWWKPREGVALGEETEASDGSKIGYVIRYDKGVSVVMRIDESEYVDFMAMLEWVLRNKGTAIQFWFDQDDATTQYSVVVESPRAGSMVEPVRDGQAHWVFTLPMTLRSNDGTRIDVPTLLDGSAVDVFLRDTFTGDSALPGHVGEVGADWTGAEIVEGDGGFTVSGGALLNPSGEADARSSGQSSSSVQRITTRFRRTGSGDRDNNASYLGFFALFSDVDVSGWDLALMLNGEGPGVVAILNGGSEPNGGFVALEMAEGDEVEVEMYVNGLDIDISVNGVIAFSAVVDQVLSGRYVALLGSDVASESYEPAFTMLSIEGRNS